MPIFNNNDGILINNQFLSVDSRLLLNGSGLLFVGEGGGSTGSLTGNFYPLTNPYNYLSGFGSSGYFPIFTNTGLINSNILQNSNGSLSISGNTTVTGTVSVTSSVIVGSNANTLNNNALTLSAGSYATWSTRGTIIFPSNGVMRLTNAAETDFGRLQFGGTTSSFPSLKRSGVCLALRLADDSNFTQLLTNSISDVSGGSGISISNGNIGINFFNPSEKFCVSGVYGSIRYGSTANSNGIYFYNGAGNLQSWFEGNNNLNTSNIGWNTSRFSIGSTTHFVSSNVGIGTTSPASRLDVTGNIRASGLYLANTANSGLQIGNTTGNWPIALANAVGNKILLGKPGTNEVSIDMPDVTTLRFNSNGAFWFNGATTLSGFQDNYLNSTAAQVRLYDINDSTSLHLAVRRTSFAAGAYVYSSQGGSLFPETNWGDLVLGSPNNAVSKVWIGRLNPTVISNSGILTSGIQTSGNIGIRNRNPQSALDVSGDILASGINLSNSNSGAIFTANSSGIFIEKSLNLSPSGFNSALFNLDKKPFYVYNGLNTSTGVLPSLFSSVGRTYFIKNRGATLTLSGQFGEYLFSTAPISNININSGEAYIVINDGSYWNLM